MKRERLSVSAAAARLGITESAVRKRARKEDLPSEKVVEGNKERLYLFLDPDEDYRQQAIILSMSEFLKALTAGPEAPSETRESSETATEGEDR